MDMMVSSPCGIKHASKDATSDGHDYTKDSVAEDEGYGYFIYFQLFIYLWGQICQRDFNNEIDQEKWV